MFMVYFGWTPLFVLIVGEANFSGNSFSTGSLQLPQAAGHKTLLLKDEVKNAQGQFSLAAVLNTNTY